jgi:hypothetical protein
VRRKSQSEPPPGPAGDASPLAWSLDLLTATFSYAAAGLAGRAIVAELVRARLADGLRDLGIEPPTPQEIDRRVSGFDEHAWGRVAIAASVFEIESLRQTLGQRFAGGNALPLIETGFLALARDLDLLPLPVLCQSETRIEELARQFSQRLDVGIEGESAAESAERLRRLDYARLLAEADRAKSSAEEQMDYLRKLQEEEAGRRRPRGKW